MQRELPGRWVADIAYVGNHGSDLPTARNINATPNQYLSTSATRDQATIDYLSALVPNPVRQPDAGDGRQRRSGPRRSRRERLLRPYPHFDAVNTTTSEGWSWYHSLQTGLQKRFVGGYTLGVNYTYSRFTEAIEFLNAGDAEPWEGVSSQDVPHRLSVSGICGAAVRPRSPLRQRRSNPAVNALIGGWQVSGDLHVTRAVSRSASGT